MGWNVKPGFLLCHGTHVPTVSIPLKQPQSILGLDFLSPLGLEHIW